FFFSLILQVSVPCNNMLTTVTVRCGHCANLLSVNMGALLQVTPIQDFQMQKQHHHAEDSSKIGGSSSKRNKLDHAFESAESEQIRIPPIRPPPEKRQRVPSAYNRFIKEEIQRIKASNPDISHREAFSTAAKNFSSSMCMSTISVVSSKDLQRILCVFQAELESTS
ncbi:YABBY protein, partial [Dillenia turbinata]